MGVSAPSLHRESTDSLIVTRGVPLSFLGRMCTCYIAQFERVEPFFIDSWIQVRVFLTRAPEEVMKV